MLIGALNRVKNKMTRRKTIGKKTKSKDAKTGSIAAARNAQGNSVRAKARHYHDFRFRVSLVILIALLSMATYALVLALAGAGNFLLPGSGVSMKESAVQSVKTKPVANAQKLDDKSLGYQLAFPQQFGEWIYKTGFVVSPTDETLTDQYAGIYVPLGNNPSATNFDAKYFNVFTIRKFSEKEWSDLEKGCKKGKTLLCEQKGIEIGNKDGSVYAYTAADNCPATLAEKCKAVENIVKSFRLN